MTDGPKVRHDRTLAYFAIVAFGDSPTAIEASEKHVKIHSMAKGIEPISGKIYDANDPDQHACERYGPGKLSPQDELQFWAECAVAAELQTFDPALVPRTRDGVRAYFESMRPPRRRQADRALPQHPRGRRRPEPQARRRRLIDATVRYRGSRGQRCQEQACSGPSRDVPGTTHCVGGGAGWG